MSVGGLQGCFPGTFLDRGNPGAPPGRGLACGGKSCSATDSLATVILHCSTLRYTELPLAFYTVYDVEENQTMDKKYFKFTRG